MTRLGDSFGLVSEDYARGRPAYPAEAVAAMLRGLPAPADVVDVGAGTGQLTIALVAAGATVTAVEPAPATRAALEQRVGSATTVLDARAEALPLPDECADLVICADSFHWLDAERAAAEFRRVLRPGGRLCLSALRPAWTAEQSGGWAEEVGAIVAPLWKRAAHPLLAAGFDLAALPEGTLFDEESTAAIPFLFRTDREGLLALFSSWSAVASLPEPERSQVRRQLDEVLGAHGVGDLELSYVAKLRRYWRERA
jgi:SAM-dependent methyltransferase